MVFPFLTHGRHAFPGVGTDTSRAHPSPDSPSQTKTLVTVPISDVPIAVAANFAHMQRPRAAITANYMSPT
jgi:hypothetical protein